MIRDTGSNDGSIVDVAERNVFTTVPVDSSPKRLAVGSGATPGGRD